MRASSSFLASLAFASLVTACSGTDPGAFGNSIGSGGSGGGSGDGGTDNPSGPTTTTGGGGAPAGPGSSGASSDAASVATVGPATSSGDVASVGTVTASVSSTAAGPTCGNGQADGGEECDGSDLGGQSCVGLGFVGGALSCTGGCTFDTDGCTECGNGAREAGEDCDDGGTDSGDGCGADCRFEGTSCQDSIDVVMNDDDVIEIATTNQGGAAAPGSCLDAAGPGRVIRVMPESDGFLRAWVKRNGTTFDSSLRMGYHCDDTFVCADSYDAGGDLAGGEVGALFVEEGQETYVIVEAFAAGEVGDFTVQLALSRGRCDGPVVIPVEPGGEDGIAAWGFNGDQGNDAFGSCGGNGEDVTYELVAEGDVNEVDVVVDVVAGFPFNPVLISRIGECDEGFDEFECSGSNGVGQSESIQGLPIDEGAWVFADSTTNSDGGFVLRVIPGGF